MADEFNPKEVGSICWSKNVISGHYHTTDISDYPNFIETIHIDDYEKLLKLYNELKDHRRKAIIDPIDFADTIERLNVTFIELIRAQKMWLDKANLATGEEIRNRDEARRRVKELEAKVEVLERKLNDAK